MSKLTKWTGADAYEVHKYPMAGSQKISIIQEKWSCKVYLMDSTIQKAKQSTFWARTYNMRIWGMLFPKKEVQYSHKPYKITWYTQVVHGSLRNPLKRQNPLALSSDLLISDGYHGLLKVCDHAYAFSETHFTTKLIVLCACV